MRTISSTIVPVLFLFASAGLSAQERETPPVTLNKVSDHVYQVSGGGGSNGGVIVGEQGVVVIDSKMDEASVQQTLQAIGELTDQPVQYLVNTHSDGDHIMGNRYFPASVTVVAHENCRDDFFSEDFGRPSDWGEPEFYPFTPSVTFTDHMNLWLGRDKVELHYFGVGHTTGDIVVYFPEEKVAFVGDQYFSDRPQLIHSNKNGNSFEHVKTLTNLLETLDAETYLSGHSDPVGRNEIEKHIQQMMDRQQKVKSLVSQEKSLDEVLTAFPEGESRLVTSIYSELTGQ